MRQLAPVQAPASNKGVGPRVAGVRDHLDGGMVVLLEVAVHDGACSGAEWGETS